MSILEKYCANPTPPSVEVLLIKDESAIDTSEASKSAKKIEPLP